MFGINVVFVMCNRVCPTFAGVPVLPEVVALSAVALVGTIDVGTLLAAWAGQTLIHIWRLEVRAHYCHNPLDQRILSVFILTYKHHVVIKPIMFLLVCALRHGMIYSATLTPLAAIPLQQYAAVQWPALISAQSRNLHTHTHTNLAHQQTHTHTHRHIFTRRFTKTYNRKHRHVHMDVRTPRQTIIHTHTFTVLSIAG